MVDVRADLGRVTVTCEGRLAARYDRSWVAHQTVTIRRTRQQLT